MGIIIIKKKMSKGTSVYQPPVFSAHHLDNYVESISDEANYFQALELIFIDTTEENCRDIVLEIKHYTKRSIGIESTYVQWNGCSDILAKAKLLECPSHDEKVCSDFFDELAEIADTYGSGGAGEHTYKSYKFDQHIDKDGKFYPFREFGIGNDKTDLSETGAVTTHPVIKTEKFENDGIHQYFRTAF